MRDLKEIVSENISRLRIDKKMTQLELGSAISYSDKAISKWERAEAIPDAYVLMKLAGIFGVTVDFLLRDHENTNEIRKKSKRTNYVAVTFVSLLAVFMAFAIAYISVLLAADYNYPLLFVYAAIVSMIIIIVFNSLWGNPALNILWICGLVAGIIVTVYLVFLFLGDNFWQILLLTIPAVLIVIACLRVRISIRLPDFLRSPEKKSKGKK